MSKPALWPRSISFVRYQGLFLSGTSQSGREFDHSVPPRLVRKLSGALPQLLYLPTRRVQVSVTLFKVCFCVHGSVHLGNIYVQFKVQLDELFYVFLFFFILSSTCFGCYFHSSSGAQLQRTAIGVCMFSVCHRHF
jgi:hypothetical protein